jgi:serine/threonine-protein kinase
VLWTQSVSIPTDDFSIATGAAASQIRRAYADHAVRDGAFTSEASSQDLKDFLTLRQRFESRQGASLDEILRGLAELRGRAPRFLDAYLLEIEVARFRFYYSRDPEVLKRAFAVAKQARALAPDDPRVLVGLFYAALAGGELATAEQALDQYERLAPGEVGVLELKSGLLLARGRTGEAIDLMRSEVQRRPSWKRLASLGVIEYQHGEIAAGRRHLEESLSRAPGNVDALSALGGLELQSGDPARAVKLYEALVQRSPGIAEVSNLGFAYFLVGRYEAAEAAFRKLMAGEPNNPFIVLNLADTELAMGRTAEAQDLYRRVVELTERDPHAADPQLLTVKAQALAHLGQGLPAVEAVREALRLDADNGPRAFEAAIVYALLGERTSALANAEIALRKGCSPSWFDMPWFNTLRSSAELQGMIAKYSAGDRRRSR